MVHLELILFQVISYLFDIFRILVVGHLGSVWMSILEGMVLNWVQYQISHDIEMGIIRILLFGCL
jgi:hypothetical protein